MLHHCSALVLQRNAGLLQTGMRHGFGGFGPFSVTCSGCYGQTGTQFSRNDPSWEDLHFESLAKYWTDRCRSTWLTYSCVWSCFAQRGCPDQLCSQVTLFRRKSVFSRKFIHLPFCLCLMTRRSLCPAPERPHTRPVTKRASLCSALLFFFCLK